ncbi:glycosyl hydrolase 115 family protein [Caulobacter hibisci]|uniref:Glycosyl hydrolase 115 family protein n=1 Tax=Caulobacter hibisci TaxID=2035993 RepID=A0ABS0SSW5_9CAUL|nr:glycosyl hydrolase 115 family protein [Caulobacter hibisci]MBI1682742.1 glycosyl hydrolase 115 family protein [Caulobacter hibisci]
MRLASFLVGLALAVLATSAQAQWVVDKASPDAFAIAGAEILHSETDFPVVGLAAQDLRDDLAAVTGKPPRLSTGAPSGKTAIVVGTLGRNPLIDGLVRDGRLKVGDLSGAWESFVIAVVDRPAPGLDKALVIVGSDRRGAAYGVYELSRAAGVSPWTWWADVKPRRRKALYVAADTRRFGPPSVKYRGIFINDEDWGLQPWAAKTFDPAYGDIGPKTYEKVFQLLLRLKANTLWPAMHEVTKPFNADPTNAALADRWGIVMGSSHAEPMLRNNVGEWKAGAQAYNYATNRQGVLDYWRERTKANGGYENIYTLGMRGIHDSGMVGGGDIDGQRALLETIFADQRGLIADHVSPKVETVPQAFTAYKEVLDVYRSGLKVPDDVTLVWPDDNFGYIRQLPNAEERKRSGGSGVYYHLSYLGAPLSHLWLSTTPPALVIEEMGRAWDLGARKLWIVNVGDIKPAELETQLFLDMAWDVERVRAQGADGYVEQFASDAFGPDRKAAIAEILAAHHQLNFERKPEHLQWFWGKGATPRSSPLSVEQADARLARFDALTAKLDGETARIPADRRDAWFELVQYPVRAAAAANHRVFDAEAFDRLVGERPDEARRRAAKARAADAEVAALTRRFNDEVAGGKWRGIMAVEPADGQWTSFRQRPFVAPAADATATRLTPSPPADTDVIVVEAETVRGDGWRRLNGLGRGGAVMVAGMVTEPSRTLAEPGPGLRYAVTLPAGAWSLDLDLLPTFPLNGETALRLAVSADDAPPIEVAAQRKVGDKAWAEGVLDGRLQVATGLTLCGGKRTVRVARLDSGVALDALVLRPVAGGCR